MPAMDRRKGKGKGRPPRSGPPRPAGRRTPPPDDTGLESSYLERTVADGLEGVLQRKRGVGMLVAEQQQGEALSKSIEDPMNLFIKNARKESLSDEDIITLVQQVLSLDTRGNKQ